MLTRGLLDTSVVIAQDEAGALTLPDEASISVVTLGELHAGVLLAVDEAVRAARLRRLASIEAAFAAVDVDSVIARRFGAVVATAKRSGRRPRVTVSMIVATAAARSLPLYTLDRDQAAVARLVGVELWPPPESDALAAASSFDQKPS